MVDWTAEYDNRAAVPEAADILETWRVKSETYRQSNASQLRADLKYGEQERNILDFFSPQVSAKGIVIFIHGGYWRMLDKSFSSFLAAGPLAHNWAIAIPSYTLAPRARIGEITREIAQAIEFAAGLQDGPIRLIGHSAGGHLVARMLCSDELLSESTFSRIEKTVAVSGLFNLENLQHTEMNGDLRLDPVEVKSESPELLGPRVGAKLTCFVGANEKPEFLRQNGLLEKWNTQRAAVDVIADQDKNHFTAIEPLSSPDSLLTTTLLS